MNLRQVLDSLNAELITTTVPLDAIEVETGAAADLMSDVLAFARPNALLITGLINPQVVRTAEIAEIRAIVFVRGKRPSQEVITLAEEAGIALLGTRYTMYETCGRLYAAGLPGIGLCTPYEPEHR